MTTNAYLTLSSAALSTICLLASIVAGEDHTVQPDVATQFVIPSNGQSSFTVGNISSSYSHLTFQAHTHRYNVSVSSSASFEKDLTLEGSHVGFVTLLKPTETEVTLYLKTDLNSSIIVVIYAELYQSEDPIPGACNQVFKLENDPNIHLTFLHHWTQVEFQWSNLGIDRGKSPKNCEIQQFQSLLRYDLYAFYFTDQTEKVYMESMTMMLEASDVMENGRKVTSVTNSGASKSLALVAAEKGQGVMYAIVVTDTTNNTMATYVPVQTYSCDLGEQDCDYKFSAVEVIISILCVILGLFLCFLGHRYLKTGFFAFGFIAFSVVFFVILEKTSSLSVEGCFGVSVTLGLGGGVLFLLLWYYWGVPVISVLLVGLTAGYLFSSLLFYTPFGNISYWDAMMTYGLTFTCGVLILPVFLLCFTRALNILSCTFVGSYLSVVCVDIYLRSGIKFIFLNSVYKQTVTGYIDAIVIFPFAEREIILAVVWGLLFFLGSFFQFWRERKKAPFPPCPAHLKKRNRLEQPSRLPENDETRPLLNEESRPLYSEVEGQLQGSRPRPHAIPSAPQEQNQPT